MTIKVPAISDTERPAPRWAVRLAYVLPLLLLPSCLWRLPFAFHFEMGQVGERHMPGLAISIPYVFGLSILTEVAALAAIGLVSRWGEVSPSWVPIVGARRVPPMLVIVPATVGGLVMTLVTVMMGLTWFGVVEGAPYENIWWEALAKTAITPIAAWGLILLALTAAYHVRRRGGRLDRSSRTVAPARHTSVTIPE
ncbi:hypothetical protein [Actinomadura sp. NEAU-AAG7]|uniref:hypothetical protein n=1 Tax=Actinomadura sp. NEAU-AAG7 TaxID=2839640 RepID=UPI001BE45857|nr:hypothetical protein [Actinomadura sp. NEAU-AAG7]MBT2212586.1 hypothetical protein [Actinomadura sp. NEAU-AAG7]